VPHSRGDEVRHFIVRHVEAHPADIARVTADEFKVEPQSIRKHLRELSSENVLVVDGKTRDRIYRLKTNDWTKSYPISAGLTEDSAWNDAAPFVGRLPENVLSIWNTGFTEMFNNAIDHSAGTEIAVEIRKTAINTEMEIRDNGVGIFKKVQAAANLPDERQAILELAKGKFTTDRTKHSGEGIFFTSKMFDAFDILSEGLSFTGTRPPTGSAGTTVWMKLDNESTRVAADIYNAFSVEDFGFDKTNVPIKMAQFAGQRMVSRSQAKRVLARIGEFKVAIFDFAGVEMIGQAFADEIFRVFHNAHPDIRLEVVNAGSDVLNMIRHVDTPRAEARHE
jgi:anti-sigma regulatory factor (Ser/Thr protein kinase)